MCAVARLCLFDVHDIDERADVLVVVEGLALELVGDGASLVVHAARVVTQIRHRGFRDEDLLCVVVGTHHAAPGVQDVVHPGTLIDLVHYGHVVLCVCDAARYGLALLLDVVVFEDQRPGFFRLVDVVVVIRENRACRLHVAHVRELQLEVDPVGLTLGLRAFLLLFLRPVLRTLRGSLAAIGLAVHAVAPFVSSHGAGRDEQCPHLLPVRASSQCVTKSSLL